MKGLREDLKNWRSILLLNISSKLLAKVFAKCFKSVIRTVIHEDQSHTVPGQQIHGALLQLRNVL